MKKKRKGAVFNRKRKRRSSVKSLTVVTVDDEVTESYDLNLPATYKDEEDDALDDSLSTATSILPSSTSTLHKRRVEEALLEYERIRIQSTLQLHQYGSTKSRKTDWRRDVQ